MTPEQWKTAQKMREGREALYIRAKAKEWCADVDHMLEVGESSHLLHEGKPKPVLQRVACHVVKHLHALGFDATWYVEAEGLRVYWGAPQPGEKPVRHHQHESADRHL